MDRISNQPLSTEYAHIDGNEKRCYGYTTLILSVYHPILMKQVELAVMECEGETTKSIMTFWNLIDKAMKEEYGENERFNPYAIISDEAGAFWRAVMDHFPEDITANSVSCEFHYKENVIKHSRAFGELHIFRHLILKEKSV